MKKCLLKLMLLIGILCWTNSSYSQFVTETAGTDTEVFPVDGEVFTDPTDGTAGGPGGDCGASGAPGNYPNCNCITETTLSAPPGGQISVTFTNFTINGNFDWMAIFDGSATATATNGGGNATNPTSADPELWNSSVDGDVLADMTTAGMTTFTSTNGSLTFVSRFSGVVDRCGWEATIAIMPPPSAGSPIYFTSVSGDIFSGSSDGSAAQNTIYTGATAEPVGIEIDPDNNMLYYAGGNTSDIFEAPLDGSGPINAIPSLSAGSEHHELEIDYDNGLVYYTSDNGGLWVGNLDGTGSSTNLVSSAVNSGVTLDRTNGVLYFNSNQSNIGRVNIDGTGLNATFIPTNGNSRGVTLDEANGQLFWVERGSNLIRTAASDGTGMPTTLYAAGGAPYGIDYDADNDILYWTTFTGGGATGTVWSAPADGSGTPTALYTGITDLRGIAAGRNIRASSAPTITCPADIMLNNTPGECSAIANFGGTATDTEDGNISGDIVATPASGSAFPVGTTPVTLSVTDSDGNTSTCMFNVVVVDNEAAVLTCPADISQTNDAGLCGADVTVPAPMIDDNCPAETNPPTPVATSPQTDFLGTTALIDTPTVISGAVMSTGGDVELTATFTGDFSFTGEVFQLTGPDGVTIINDNTNTLDCPATPNMAVATIAEATWNGWITTFGNDLTFTLLANASVNPGLCTDNFYSLSARQGDPVAGGTLSNDFNGTNDASGFYPVGDTVVTFTYTDAGGNVATCSMTVTVTDDEAPMIVCIGGPSASAGSATGTGGAIPDNNPVGLTTTLDVTDDFDITDLNVNLDITHTWIGDLAVTLTAPDGTTMAAIMDRPGVPATVVGCNNADPAINIDLDDEAVDTVEDSCPEPYVGSFIPNEALSAFNGISTLGTWTLEITDSAAGDTGTLNGWTLNYEYSVAASPAFPVILDADGNATVTASDLIDATASSDNCGIASITVEGMGGAPAPGSLTTTFAGGNGIRSMMFDVNALEDATIDSFEVNLDDSAVLDIEVYAKTGTHVGSENTPGDWTLIGTAPGVVSAGDGLPTPLNLALDYAVMAGQTYAFYISSPNKAASLGFNYTNGTNVGDVFAADATIEILEGVAVSYPFGTIFSPRVFNGTVEYTAGSGAPGPVTTFDVDCSDVGENQIEVTVTDVNGNVSTCTATYEVIDNIDPILVCQDFTLELGADGTAMLDPMDLIDMTNTIEACGISIDAVSMDDFSCDDIGTPQTVTLFVSDPSGNLASCEATVTVVDLLRTRSYLSCRYDCRSGSKQPIV